MKSLKILSIPMILINIIVITMMLSSEKVDRSELNYVVKFGNYCGTQYWFCNDVDAESDYFLVLYLTNGNVQTNIYGYGNYACYYDFLYVPGERWEEEKKFVSIFA